MTCRWQLCMMVYQTFSNITAAHHNLFVHINHTRPSGMILQWKNAIALFSENSLIFLNSNSKNHNTKILWLHMVGYVTPAFQSYQRGLLLEVNSREMILLLIHGALSATKVRWTPVLEK